MAFIAKIEDKEYRIKIKKEGLIFDVSIDDEQKQVEVVEQTKDRFIIVIDRKTYCVFVESDNRIMINGEEYDVQVMDEKVRQLIKQSPDKLLKKEVSMKAPMPGLIVDLFVKQGEKVAAGQGLIVVEAMKMQNEIKASRAGVVKKIIVKKDQTVNRGDTLIVLE